VEDRLRFMGLLDDHALAELYARAACVVVPSLRESFCIPALEAQRARSPLAISDLPALVEVAGEDVPRFDPADPEACARAVRRAMQTGTGEIEERARRAERFGWDLSAELLVTVWCRAAEGSSG
jgi:glycosyltransferase involved in cell wall biosynthesis